MESAQLERLGETRERFHAFVRSRIANPELAEDVLQSSLVKAAENLDQLRDQENLIPWFYSILRNAITDAYRSGGREREVELKPDLDLELEADEVGRLCECFEGLLPTIKPEYAELIEVLDLRQENAALTAQRLKVTANNLKVRHHRARQALRRRLEETCRVCAEHHCLDCTCRAETGT